MQEKQDFLRPKSLEIEFRGDSAQHPNTTHSGAHNKYLSSKYRLLRVCVALPEYVTHQTEEAESASPDSLQPKIRSALEKATAETSTKP